MSQKDEALCELRRADVAWKKLASATVDAMQDRRRAARRAKEFATMQEIADVLGVSKTQAVRLVAEGD